MRRSKVSYAEGVEGSSVSICRVVLIGDLFERICDAMPMALTGLKFETGERYRFAGPQPRAYISKGIALIWQDRLFIGLEQIFEIRFRLETSASLGFYSKLRKMLVTNSNSQASPLKCGFRKAVLAAYRVPSHIAQ